MSPSPQVDTGHTLITSNYVTYTHSKREESIAKRRNFQPIANDDELDSDDDADASAAPLDDTLPPMLQAIYSTDAAIQLDATMKFRK